MRTLKLLVVLALCLLPATAHAVTYFAFAEDATLATATDICAITEHQGTSSNYTTVDCTGSGETRVAIPLYRPVYDPSSWPKAATVKVHYETPDTSSNTHCDWDVAIYIINTYTSSGTVQPALVNASSVSTTAVTGTTQTHAADTRYITPATSTFNLKDPAGSDCSNGNAGCADGEAVVIIDWDDASSTASECRLRAVEVNY